MFCSLYTENTKVIISYDATRSQISHLVIVVLQVWMLTLQLNHLQPGDPLLLFGRHEITVRIPALWFSTNRSYISVNNPSFFHSMKTKVQGCDLMKHQPLEYTLFLTEESFMLGVELSDRTRVPEGQTTLHLESTMDAFNTNQFL